MGCELHSVTVRGDLCEAKHTPSCGKNSSGPGPRRRGLSGRERVSKPS